MRRSPRVLTIAMVFSAGLTVLAADDFLYSRFSDYLDALRTQAGIPGLAAAIVGPSGVAWEAAFGQQDVDRNIATRTDTPFQLDGTTEAVVSSLALWCAEQGWLSLNDRVASYAPTSPDAGATLLQLMSHTTAGPRGLTFSYRPDRLAPLAVAVGKCTDPTMRSGVRNLLNKLSMIDSVPGSDVVQLTPPQEQFTAKDLTAYADTLQRLAVPYSVDARRHATRSSYVATTLTPASGLISSVRDLEQFDLELKRGRILDPDWLSFAWTPPRDANGAPLPHGYGWFVQTINSEKVVWQFGVSDNASSSMMMTLPSRNLTLIMLANSHGLVRPFALSEGDVTVSPFARLFLTIFAR